MLNKQLKIITVLSVLLAVTVAIVSYYGIFVPGTYERETVSLAAQGIGQDITDLFLVVPLVLISLILIRRNNRVAFYIYGGTVFYILYTFVIYCFGLHFNNFFLLYCLALGLSLYAIIFIFYALNRMDVQNWFDNKVPTRLIGIYLIIVSVMFYFLWLKDIIPAILNNSIPKSVSDYKLLVNPVHVIDISFALPGLIITSILLMRKHKTGYILVPVCLVFIIIMAIALAIMVIVLKVKGINDETSVACIFIILAVISLIFLFVFLKRIKS